MLSVKNLVVKYGMFRALDGVSIKVEEGQMVGIVGANGAGKSTHDEHRLAAPRRRPRARLRSRTQDLTKMSAHEIVRAGVVQVPEGRRSLPRHDGLENLLVGSAHKRAKAERTENFERVYHALPAPQRAREAARRTLSGGEQQMVAVARALMRPAHPDDGRAFARSGARSSSRRSSRWCRRLKYLGLTILLVEQNVHHCLKISDYAYVLETGELVLEGTGQGPARQPAHQGRLPRHRDEGGRLTDIRSVPPLRPPGSAS